MTNLFQYLFVAKKPHWANKEKITSTYNIVKSNVERYESIPSFHFSIGELRGKQADLKPKAKYSIESIGENRKDLSLQTGLIAVSGQPYWYKGKNYLNGSMQDLIAIKLNNDENIYILVAPQLYSKATNWKSFSNYDLNVICDEEVERLKPDLFDVEVKLVR